jgi:hypothetical protein
MAARLSALRAGRTLPPGFLFFLFLLEDESTLGAIVRSEELGKLEKNPPHGDANPRPSSLQHSTITTTVPRGWTILKWILER